MTNNTTPETSEELRERITDYLGNGGLFTPEMMEHEKVRQLLRDCREQLVPQRCKCVCHEYPQHGKLQDALEALKWHQQEISRVRTEERERAKAEVAAAYLSAVDAYRTCRASGSEVESLEAIKYRTPADASRALELAILDARIEEAKWWRYLVYMHEESYFMVETKERLSALKARRDALAKEAGR